MIDRFDDGFCAPQPQPRKATRTYDPVPVGVCEVEIVKAERKALPWRASEKNPGGNCMALRLSAGSAYGFVFCDVPDDKQWVREHVARAVGIEVDLCVPEELIGRQANVEIDHITTRSGDTRAVVRKWLPASTLPPSASHTSTLADAVNAWTADEKREPPRQSPRQPVKRSRNAPPQIGPDDDIPF